MAATLSAPTTPTFQLIYDDGENLESDWHRIQMTLLIDVIRQAMAERGRSDFFAGGNMFIYYSISQARAVATEPSERTRHFRGPDVFWVGSAEPRDERLAWVVWEEDGRYPDFVVELLSPSTAKIDRTTKKAIYERTFRTPDYFLYDRAADRVEGFHLVEGSYRPVAPDDTGRWRVDSLDLWLGKWHGPRGGIETVWLRLFDRDGRMIPTPEEAERQRADAAEAELSRLRGSGPGHRAG